MAEENKERNASRVEEPGQQEQTVVDPAPPRDAALTCTQPTSYRLPASMMVRGDMPDNRFTEEVVKGSDEDTGGGWDTHPEENQPVPGIGPDDELPDTTGRAALKDLKK